MRYELVVEPLSEFEGEVNKFLGEGWELYGNVSSMWITTEYEQILYFYQALVKKELEHE